MKVSFNDWNFCHNDMLLGGHQHKHTYPDPDVKWTKIGQQKIEV